MKTSLPIFTAFVLFAAGCLTAQEARTWTNAKGQKLEGSLVKQDDTTVWVLKGDGKEVAIPKRSLSEEDQKHLQGAVPASAAASAAGRFATARIDPAAWKPRVDGFKLGTLVYPAHVETEHFVVAAISKIRPAMLLAYAEAAERLWTDIAADLPALAKAYEGRKLPIILANDEKDAETFSNWHDEHADASNTVARAYNLEGFTIASFSLDEEFAKEAGLTISGRLFRMDAKKAEHARKTWPQRIHFLTDDIIRHMLGNLKNNEDNSLSLTRLCFCYQREELVCGRIESEVTFGGGGDVEGFKNGRNWAGATKKLLKAGSRPDIASFLETPGAKAEPRDLGFGLGLMHFIHAAPARLDGFGKVLADAGAAKKCPDPETFATGLGFDSPEALNVAWRTYMESDAFQ